MIQQSDLSERQMGTFHAGIKESERPAVVLMSSTSHTSVYKGAS